MKWVAAAIVLAGAMISIALYFALAPRAQVTPIAPVVPVVAPPSVDVLQLTTQALASYRPGLRMACWPADAGVSSAKWTLDLTFDANGTQIARGFREERGAANSDVTKCVDRLLPALHIAAPGRNTRVEVPYELP